MITAFLPCRKGSQRIPDKNVKPFAGVKGGLLHIKLNQLAACKAVDRILVSSNDERVLDYASRMTDSRIVIDERPEHLGSSQTTTDELIQYVSTLIAEGDILWTHVTSPFVTEHHYEKLIRQFYEKLEQNYDSLMTAKKIQGFLWNENQAANYDRAIEKWPRTQTIEPLYEIDSAVFIANAKIYRSMADRIGSKPFVAVQESICSIDIDWPDDFEMAEMVFKFYNSKFKDR
ncbi:acylneuraminate cytidylyltransferase family protein [Shewanella cyperi]|uniref:Acylneuraminate cytidylyltransferase family protein n=1 Tax=Shewanella cyperi TaxID=2814292 RepID=A0A974XIB7_9GAMM|nr:acylneuraminate cytidylyltransferase family protein [Shewanella cyperi]QSX28915.1 acylneuraminate cytidylyltransferase family protein [Shewanella cyperi]